MRQLVDGDRPVEIGSGVLQIGDKSLSLTTIERVDLLRPSWKVALQAGFLLLLGVVVLFFGLKYSSWVLIGISIINLLWFAYLAYHGLLKGAYVVQVHHAGSKHEVLMTRLEDDAKMVRDEIVQELDMTRRDKHG